LLVQNKRTKQKDNPYSPFGFPALLKLSGHFGNSLRSNSQSAYPDSFAMLGFVYRYIGLFNNVRTYFESSQQISMIRLSGEKNRKKRFSSP
jgi:hypothetical protein